MELFSERKRLNDIGRRENEGESLWTSELDDRVRTKLIHILRDEIDDDGWSDIRERACRARGVDYLYSANFFPESDVEHAIRRLELDLVADILEAALWEINRCVPIASDVWTDGKRVQDSLNEMLSSHRVAVDLIAG